MLNELKAQITALWNAITVSPKNKDAQYIADHPEEFGYSWGSGALGRGTGANYVELRKDFPHIEVATDTEGLLLFAKSFGTALVAKGLNGTSYKVTCDRINRDAHDDNRAITTEQLKLKIVNSLLLGVITKGFATTKYVVAGQTFANAQDAEKFAANQARIKDLESAQAFLAMAAENGIDTGVARMMAKQQYPLAFEPVTPITVPVDSPDEPKHETPQDESSEN